jgi:hypothetical protein
MAIPSRLDHCRAAARLATARSSQRFGSQHFGLDMLDFCRPGPDIGHLSDFTSERASHD